MKILFDISKNNAHYIGELLKSNKNYDII
jgi:hypothetical protein